MSLAICRRSRVSWRGCPNVWPAAKRCALTGGPQTNYLLWLQFDGGVEYWVAAADDPNGCVGTTNGAFSSDTNIGLQLTAAMKTGTFPAASSRFPNDPCWEAGRLGQGQAMVPSGATTADLCVQHGDAVRHVHLTTGLVTLADLLNEPKAQPSKNSCAPVGPATIAPSGTSAGKPDSGPYYTLAFHYPQGPGVFVRAEQDCTPNVDNSSLQASVGPSLFAELDSLLKR